MEFKMYKFKKAIGQLTFFNNFFTCNKELDPQNRWVVLSELIPWDEIEIKYKGLFADEGAPGKAIRLALGALIIKERLSLTDEETLQQITENPYLQYFVGFEQFGTQKPFTQSSMTYFRKRFTTEIMNEINEMICFTENTRKLIKTDNDNDDDNQTPSGGCNGNSTEESAGTENRGTLILDATCVPADIHYPTDVTLLNDAREIAEDIIDILHEPFIGEQKKPRDYRIVARKRFLEFIKRRKPNGAAVRKAIRKQLGFLGRDLRIIRNLVEKSETFSLPKPLYKKLLVINELYRQQKYMYKNKIHKVDDRIVSIHQPHIRPIVRGKASADVEFGAKISVSVVDGLTFLETLSFDNYNESNRFIETVEEFKRRYGFYPQSILVDQIYRNRENRKFCKLNGIRINGPKLGRPTDSTKEEMQCNRLDEGQRNRIEGKFGEAKRKYGLDRILTRLPETTGCTIAVNCIVLNLKHLLRLSFFSFFNVQLWLDAYKINWSGKEVYEI